MPGTLGGRGAKTAPFADACKFSPSIRKCVKVVAGGASKARRPAFGISAMAASPSKAKLFSAQISLLQSRGARAIEICRADHGMLNVASKTIAP
jgi:hypothetical protein